MSCKDITLSDGEYELLSDEDMDEYFSNYDSYRLNNKEIKELFKEIN